MPGSGPMDGMQMDKTLKWIVTGIIVTIGLYIMIAKPFG